MSTEKPRSKDQVGPYEIEARLGEGGMGEVYQAIDKRLGRKVALKHIRTDITAPTVNERFMREARSLAALNSPSIVQIYDLLEIEGEPWIVMELVEGSLLSSILKKAPLPAHQALAITRDIAEGLSVAHGAGVVHRDLKAPNLIVASDGRTKILDFGIARSDEHQDSGISRAGQVIGTPSAMSPEQALGRRVDHRSDLFSLGSLLYEMLSGVSPFSGETSEDTFRRVVSHRQPSLSSLRKNLPDELSSLVDSLLEKKRSHRLASATALIRAIDTITKSGERSTTWYRDAAVKTGESTLTEDAESETPGGLERASRSAHDERRQVTVLCCEIAAKKGAMLDPEDVAELVPLLMTLAHEIRDNYEGALVESQGHRLTLVFGTVVAHEDDAVRAIISALAMVKSFVAQAGSPDLGLRVGLNTGVGIAHATGEMPRFSTEGSGTSFVLGQTQDVAFELSKQAPLNAIAISPTTYRLVRSEFDFEDAPADSESHIVLRRKASGGRFATATTALVSRDLEVRLIADRWNLALQGEGQVVQIGGEAGIGKSRLLEELRDRLTDGSPNWVVASGSAHHAGSPFQPIIELLKRLAPPESESTEHIESALGSLLDELQLTQDENLPFLSSLLGNGIDAEKHPAAATLGLDAQRKAAMEALVSLILGLAQAGPVIFVVEDVHYLDASTLEFLEDLIDQATDSELLILLTHRPSFESPWPNRVHITNLALNRLFAKECEQLLEQLPGAEKLDAETRRQIIEISDGVPLFVEEVASSVIEEIDRAGTENTLGEAVPISVPLTLRSALAARLDRLGPAKQIAQLAAAQGREFSRIILAATSSAEDHDLDSHLELLSERGLIRRVGRLKGGEQMYVFKHALVRDAAYEAVLRADKARIHQEIAQAIEKHKPEVAEAEPEILAHHYQESAQLEKAGEYWQLALGRAFARSAYVEAAAHAGRANLIVARMPVTEDSQRARIQLLVSQALAIGFSTRMDDPRRKTLLDEALDLSRKIKDDRTAFGVQSALWIFHLFQLDLEATIDAARLCVEIGERGADPVHEWMGKHLLATTLYYEGDFKGAIDLYEPARKALPALIAAAVDGDKTVDSEIALANGISATAYRGRCLAFLGHLDQAIEMKDEILEVARERIRLIALSDFGELLLERGEDESAERLLKEAVDVAESIGVDNLFITPLLFHGQALARLGREKESKSQIDRGFQFIESEGLTLWKGQVYAASIDAALLRGDFERGLELAEEAVEHASSTLDSCFLADIQRLQGELFAKQGDLGKARLSLEAAIDTSRKREARLQELRALTSLADLLEGSDRDSALQQLARVYVTFDEGLDCRDPMRARALLDGAGLDLQALE